MYNITFQQIETFLAIGRCLNMSRAAESLYISQPTLSKTIQRFENGIGFTVFVRTNQGVAFTPQGEYLFGAFESLYDNMEKAIRTAKSLTPSPNKMLKIVAPSSYGASHSYDILKQYVRDYARKYPDVIIVEQLCDFKWLQRQFDFGETDIAFRHSFIMPENGEIEYKYICEYPMYVAVGMAHPMTAYDTVQPDMLNGYIYYAVSPTDEAESRDRIIRRCERVGFTPSRIEYVDNFPTLLYMLHENRGVSICGKFSTMLPNEIKYYPLNLGEMNASILVAWYPERLTKQAKDFIQMLPK